MVVGHDICRDLVWPDLYARHDGRDRCARALDLLWWPFDGTQPYTEGAMRFLSALTGGFLTGWGALIFCLRRWVYDLAPEQTRRAVLAGLLSWFVIDSLGSVMSGAVPNVFFNVVVLLTAAGPLWRPAREA
jgi:hypothetical protein